MSGRILTPGGSGQVVGADGGLARGLNMQPTEIGGTKVPVCQDTDAQPGLTPQAIMRSEGLDREVLDLDVLLNFVNALSGCLHATMREVVTLRAEVEQLTARAEDAETTIESVGTSDPPG